MCASHVFCQQQQETQASNQQNIVIPTMIESLVKKFKTHCCALDFNHGFIKAATKQDEEQRDE